MDIDELHVKRQFATYAGDYDVSDPKIALKVAHTFKVADICKRIATSRCYSQEFTDLAWLSGMLHDIGRFEQISQYGTFIDSASVPHARLSVKILFEDGEIAKYVDIDSLPQNYLDALRTAIESHSDWRLPEDLNETSKTLCNVLRDADKLDIMRVNCTCPVDVIYPFSEEELLESQVSPEVVEVFNSHETVPASIRRFPADYALSHCAFGWELVFPESRQIALQDGYLEQLFEHKWKDPSTRKTFEGSKADMMAWLSKSQAE